MKLTEYLLPAFPVTVLGILTWWQPGHLLGFDSPPIDAIWAREVLPIGDAWSNSALVWESGSSFGTDGAVSNWHVVNSIVLSLITLIFSSDTAHRFIIGCGTFGLGTFITYYVFRTLRFHPLVALLSAISYSFGTYFVIQINRGHVFEVASSSFIPLLLVIINSFRKSALYIKPITAIFIGSAISAFEPRFAFMSIFFMSLYTLLLLFFKYIEFSRAIIWSFIFLCCGSILPHLSWLSQIAIFGVKNSYIQSYHDVSSLRNLSLSGYQLEDSLTSRHPLWPYSLSWEADYYLDVPFFWKVKLVILVFCLLLSPTKRFILPTALMWLVSSFFAKGSNEPFGILNEWIFSYVPGFNAFRASEKFAILSQLFSSILIGHWIYLGLYWIKNKLVWVIFILTTFLFVILPITPYIIRSDSEHLSYFIPKYLPADVYAFQESVKNSERTGRILVVPWGGQGFATSSFNQYVSLYHIVDILSIVSRDSVYFFSRDKLDDYKKLFSNPRLKDILWAANFKKILVPYDADKIVFGRDGNGFGESNPGRDQTRNLIELWSGIAHNPKFETIGVFDLTENPGPAYIVHDLKNDATGSEFPYEEIIPTEASISYSANIHKLSESRYLVKFKNKENGWLILSQNFSPLWRLCKLEKKEFNDFGSRGLFWWSNHSLATSCENSLFSQHVSIMGFMNTWRIKADPGDMLFIEYFPQRIYETGWLITICIYTLFFLLCLFFTINKLLRLLYK